MSISWPFPKTLLRIGMIFCLVGAPATAILSARIAVADSLLHERMHVLSVLLFTLFFPFTLLYIEYEIAQKITKCDLNARIGYIQSLGCLALLLYGMAAALFFPAEFSDTTLLLLLCIFGEAIFLINVVWSYIEQKSAPPKRRTTPRKPQGKWQWSRSPTQLFGIGAALFAALGLIFLVGGSSQLPFPVQGRISFVPTGLLGLTAAALFAVFALLYWFMERDGGRTFHETVTRIHFMFTLAIVVDALRAYTAWSMTVVNKYAAPVTAREFLPTLIFAVLASAAFLWNIFREERTGTG